MVYKFCNDSWAWWFTKPLLYIYTTHKHTHTCLQIQINNLAFRLHTAKHLLIKNKQKVRRKSQAFLAWRNLPRFHHRYASFQYEPCTSLHIFHQTTITVHKFYYTSPVITWKLWSQSTTHMENTPLEFSSSNLPSDARKRKLMNWSWT